MYLCVIIFLLDFGAVLTGILLDFGAVLTGVFY
jgi:hypothetical protein